MKNSILFYLIISLTGQFRLTYASSEFDLISSNPNENNESVSVFANPSIYNGNGNGYNNPYPYPYRKSVRRQNYRNSDGLGRRRRRHHHKKRCQAERIEHQVIMKKYNDTTGYWVLYTQIVETRNIANKCNRNEYVYLAKRMRAGWLWNPKISSLVQYSLGEPKFITRKVSHPDRPLNILVNMSRNYSPQAIDLDRLFPKSLAYSLVRTGNDDTKWSELARSALPILQMEVCYFELVRPKENTGSQYLHILDRNQLNREILE